jgi:hypothetical protein
VAWVYESFPEFSVPPHRIVTLTRDDPANPENVAPNAAFEALPLARFITRHYDDFPDRLIFLHSARRPWHALGGDMVPIVKAVNLSLDYAPLSLHEWSHIGAEGVTPQEIAAWHRAKNVAELIGLPAWLGPFPRDFYMFCCVQYLLSRDLIRSRPLAMWRAIDDFLSAGDYSAVDPEFNSDKFVATAMEQMWHWILTGEPKEHRFRNACDVLDCTVWQGPHDITSCCSEVDL